MDTLLTLVPFAALGFLAGSLFAIAQDVWEIRDLLARAVHRLDALVEFHAPTAPEVPA